MFSWLSCGRCTPEKSHRHQIHLEQISFLLLACIIFQRLFACISISRQWFFTLPAFLNLLMILLKLERFCKLWFFGKGTHPHALWGIPGILFSYATVISHIWEVTGFKSASVFWKLGMVQRASDSKSVVWSCRFPIRWMQGSWDLWLLYVLFFIIIIIICIVGIIIPNLFHKIPNEEMKKCKQKHLLLLLLLIMQ